MEVEESFIFGECLSIGLLVVPEIILKTGKDVSVGGIIGSKPRPMRLNDGTEGANIDYE